MKILSLLIFLASVRACTKESSSSERKAEATTQSVEQPALQQYATADTVIVSVLGMYYDDFKTRGLTSDASTKLSAPPAFTQDFYQRFSYPEVAKLDQLDGSCTVQFGIDAASKIHFFSVLETDSKIFSDNVRQAIVSKPIVLTPFPKLPQNVDALRVEVRVEYKLKSISKL